jgi:malonyl CoA-acyl carrier protein transacylase
MPPRLAFVFPGQGSQYVGMGRALYERFPEARAIFEEADRRLGYALSRLCFEGRVLKWIRPTDDHIEARRASSTPVH